MQRGTNKRTDSRGRGSSSSFRGAPRRGSGSSFSERPAPVKRTEPKNCEFRLNMIPLEVKDLVNNLPKSFVLSSQYSNISAIAEVVPAKDVRYIKQRIDQFLNGSFKEEYVFDGQNRIYALTDPTERNINIEYGRRDDTTSIDFCINDSPPNDKLSQSEVESLLNNIILRILMKQPGSIYKGGLYTSDNSSFAKEVKSIVKAVEQKYDKDTADLLPFVTARGFQPKAALYYVGKPTPNASVIDEIKNDVVKCYCTITIKTASYLPTEMSAIEFETKVKKAICWGRSAEESDRSYDELMRKMSIRRTYMKKEDSKYQFEPCKGVGTTPASQVKVDFKDGRKMTIVDYFKEKGITIDGKLRPIEVKGIGSDKSSIPADLVAIPPQYVTAFDSPLQGKTTNLSRTTPNHYAALCKYFANYFFIGCAELKKWGISTTTVEPRVMPGFESSDPEIKYAGATPLCATQGTWNLKDLKLFKAIGGKPITVLDLNATKSFNEFIDRFISVHKKLGIMNEVKSVFSTFNFRKYDVNTCERELTSQADALKGTSGCYIILPMSNTDLVYNVVKTVFDARNIPTQCMKVQKTPLLNGRPPRGNPDQHFANLISGLNVKASGINHIISPNSFKQLQVNLEGAMIIGIDLQHARKDFGGKGTMRISTISIVATLDESLTATANSGGCQTYAEDLIQGGFVTQSMTSIMDQRKQRGYTSQIKHVIIFRDGIDFGSYSDFLRIEVDNILSVIEKDQGSKPKCTSVVVMKRHGVRILPADMSQSDNVAPGSICGISTKTRGFQRLPDMVHFMLMGHHAIPGSTAVPVRVGILSNPLAMPPYIVACLLFYMQHLDQVVQKTVSLPFAALYAHKGAERVSKFVDVMLQKRLYNMEDMNKELVKCTKNMSNCGFL